MERSLSSSCASNSLSIFLVEKVHAFDQLETWSALERSVVNGQSIKAPFPSRRQWENHLLFQLFSSKISNPVEDEIFSDEMNETDWIVKRTFCVVTQLLLFFIIF